MKSGRAVIALSFLAWSIPASAEPSRADSIASPHRELRVELALQASLSLRERWQPTSLAPDVYYGIAPGFTLGWVHSTHALGLLRSDTGLCLRDRQDGCAERYSGTGLDLIASLLSTRRWWIAGRGRLYVERYTEPIKPRLAPGVVIAGARGRLSLLVDAHIAFGLYNLERGNENTLHVPVWLGARVAGPVSLYLRTGLDGGLSYFRDKLAVPLGLGISSRLPRNLEISAQLVLPKIIGPLNSPRNRQLAVRLITRFP